MRSDEPRGAQHPKREQGTVSDKETHHPSVSTRQVSATDRLLTINEVAELTGLSVGGLYHLVSQGRIPVVRISRRCIRFRQSALHAWWDDMASAPTK
jgi:excisionase family DNA binding protein